MKNIFVLALLLVFSGAVFPEVPDSEEKTVTVDPVKDKKKYDAAFEKWQTNGATSYSMRLKYAAFSPLSGIWEVVVYNGKVVRWKFKNTVNNKRYENFASGLTMERLFEIAELSLHNGNDRPFLIIANYDIERGYVRNVSRMKNDDYTGNIPTDKNFRYEVHAFTIHESKRRLKK